MSRKREGNGVYTLGFLGAVLLTLALPFDLTDHPLFQTPLRPLTDLSLLLVLVVGLAMASLIAASRNPIHGRADVAGHRGGTWRQLWSALILIALLVDCSVSSIAAHRLDLGLPWLLDLVAGWLICMALPLWLGEDGEHRMAVIARSLVAGAVIAAIIGFAEFWMGAALERRLLWFRPGPTTMGPFIRLTSTFHHANEAAMYFGLALPFTCVGLARALSRRRTRVETVAWAITVVVMLMALLLTYSRGGLLGLAASAVVMIVASRRTLFPLSMVGGRLALAVVVAVPACAFLASTFPIDVLRVTTQNDASWYRVGYASQVPASLSAGQSRTVRVTVENQSGLTWESSKPDDYALSYHWLYPSWRVAEFNCPLVWIRGRVDPGQSRTLQTSIRAPAHPGRYLLVWDLLWHRTTWFGLKTGALRPIPVYVLLGPKRAGPQNLFHSAPELTLLPFAQTADRIHIWRVAARLIASHPLLGLGPHGFRRNYATPAPASPHGRVSPPSNAHNLVLELMADWGVVAGILFLLLMLTLWWPLCAAAVRGTLTSPWQVAVLGAGAAFAAHSAVEFYLGTPAILFAGWLMCGLALATRPGPAARPPSSTLRATPLS